MDEYGVCHIGKCGAVSDGVTNVDAVIQKELSAGAMRFWLPANTLWQPERNYVPGGLEIQGEDWTTDIIAAANPQEEYVVVGPHTTCINVAFLDQVEPGILGMGRKSPRPVRLYQNLCSGDAIPTHYAWTGTMMTSSGTGQDLCALTLNGRGVGDVVFIGADQSATGLDMFVNSEDPNESATGIMQHVFGKGPAIHIIGRDSASSTYALHRIEQRGKGPSLLCQPGALADEVVVIQLGYDATGRCLHFYQHTGTYDGTPIALNMGRGGGKYTGSPFWYRNGEGPLLFELTNDGSVESEQMTAIERRLAELEQKLSLAPGT